MFSECRLGAIFSLVMNGQTQKTRGWLGAAGDECGILVADIPACLKQAVVSPYMGKCQEEVLELDRMEHISLLLEQLCLLRNRGSGSFL